jgi:hypothetical protein
MVTVIIVMVLARGALAQTGTACTEPRSPNSVLLDITDAGEWVATLGAVDGGRAQLSFGGGGTLLLFPALAGQVLEVRYVEAVTRPGRTDLRHVATLELVRDQAEFLSWGTRRLGFTWRDVMPLSPDQIERIRQACASAAGRPSPEEPDEGPCVICCVSCDGDRHCGCPVATPCGSCCCPLGCDCPDAPVP